MLKAVRETIEVSFDFRLTKRGEIDAPRYRFFSRIGVAPGWKGG
jgi:hypothetical protein